jgi:hypothetical protein
MSVSQENVTSRIPAATEDIGQLLGALWGQCLGWGESREFSQQRKRRLQGMARLDRRRKAQSHTGEE